jgi:hypothetical protein
MLVEAAAEVITKDLRGATAAPVVGVEAVHMADLVIL